MLRHIAHAFSPSSSVANNRLSLRTQQICPYSTRFSSAVRSFDLAAPSGCPPRCWRIQMIQSGTCHGQTRLTSPRAPPLPHFGTPNRSFAVEIVLPLGGAAYARRQSQQRSNFAPLTRRVRTTCARQRTGWLQRLIGEVVNYLTQAANSCSR